jgi:hypothetical protein
MKVLRHNGLNAEPEGFPLQPILAQDNHAAPKNHVRKKNRQGMERLVIRSSAQSGTFGENLDLVNQLLFRKNDFMQVKTFHNDRTI